MRVVPDEVVITLGVESLDPDLDAAKRQNDDAGQEGHRHRQAVGRQAGAHPDRVPERGAALSRQLRQARVPGLLRPPDAGGHAQGPDQVRGAARRGADGGVNYVHGVEFRTTELRKHKDTARALAVKAAREKATAMAGELGPALGEPRTITRGAEQLLVLVQLLVGKPLGRLHDPERHPECSRLGNDHARRPSRRARSRSTPGCRSPSTCPARSGPDRNFQTPCEESEQHEREGTCRP